MMLTIIIIIIISDAQSGSSLLLLLCLSLSRHTRLELPQMAQNGPFDSRVLMSRWCLDSDRERMGVFLLVIE